jgi:tRNA A-37 threonylcarbamoyl transferase component Bud32
MYFREFLDAIKSLRETAIKARHSHITSCTGHLLLACMQELNVSKLEILKRIQHKNVDLLNRKRKHSGSFDADGFKLPKKAKLSHLPDIDPLLEEKMELLLGSSPGVSLEQTNNTNEANNIEVPRIEVNNKRYESPQKTSTSPNNENHDNDEDNDEKENKKPELVKTNSKVSLESVLEYWAVDASEVNKESNMLLGQGHFANVYKGTFRGLEVAIKCLNKKVSDSEFMRELARLTALRHPGLVQFLACVPDLRWFILEWMERGSLFNLLHDRGAPELSWKRKISLAKDVASTMLYLHKSKIRHCDLNSKNLLISKEFKIKVSDLGLSEEVTDGCSQTDKRMGTLRWMAPEILKKHCMSMEKADVYSFGIVMFELGAQMIPYHDRVDADVRSMVHKGLRPKAPDAVWGGCVEYYELMTLCWHSQPEKRPSFSIIHERLAEMLTKVDSEEEDEFE